MEPVRKYAHENYEGEKEENILDNPVIKDLFRREIDALSTDLSSYETIKEFTLIEQPFSLEKGELTPSLKVKRNVIEEKYKQQIDKMYPIY